MIFLDSDNVAVADPTALLHSPAYLSSGAMLWPDYWKSFAAFDLVSILDMPSQPSISFESGQMVFDKERHAPSSCRADSTTLQTHHQHLLQGHEHQELVRGVTEECAVTRATFAAFSLRRRAGCRQSTVTPASTAVVHVLLLILTRLIASQDSQRWSLVMQDMAGAHAGSIPEPGGRPVL